MDGSAIQMLNNIGKFMTEIVDVIQYPCYAAGIFCACSALAMMASQRQENAIGKGIMLIFVAGLIASLPSFVGDFGVTFFGKAPTTALSFAPGDPSALGQETVSENTATVKQVAIGTMFLILKVVGYIAIYKGCNRLKFYNMSPNGDPRLMSEAFTLIFMGGLTVYAKDLVLMIGHTVGGPVQETISKLIV